MNDSNEMYSLDSLYPYQFVKDEELEEVCKDLDEGSISYRFNYGYILGESLVGRFESDEGIFVFSFGKEGNVCFYPSNPHVILSLNSIDGILTFKYDIGCKPKSPIVVSYEFNISQASSHKLKEYMGEK